MASNISPGVYTKIIDLSAYVAEVPSTIGCICYLSEKGEDNTLKFIGSRQELISEFGEPNIATYGKAYGQGLYEAYNFLGESGALYVLRGLPDDATYANMRIDAVMGASDATCAVEITYVDSLNSKTEMITNLQSSAPTYPLGFLYPIGRGQYYNKLAVRITEVANPIISDVYVIDVYEKQSDGDDQIVESFEISFDPRAMDDAGSSIYVGEVLDLYSGLLRWEMILSNEEYTDGYKLLAKIYDKDIGLTTIDINPGTAEIADNKQDFSDYQTNPATGNAEFMIAAKDGKGNKIWGWIGLSAGVDNEVAEMWDGRDLDSSSRGWQGDLANFDPNSSVTYLVKKADTSIATAFTSSTPVPLRKGSDGSLLDASGDLDTAEATQLLSQAYAGLIDDAILDTENYYFTIVWDAGYPSDVKTQISSLVQTRRDCVAIIDNGDNPTFNAAITRRLQYHTYNNYFTAIYEEFNKVYDPFTGQDVWFSPLYHMSYLLPRNDNVAEIWWAAAGFNRGAIESIKELRFNPKQGQRDQMYLKQLNPIVKFNQGYVVWGQLTSQARPSALQDLNIVRLVLYCKRALEQFCRFYIFELNDEITWSKVSGEIVEFLERIKQKRGLYNYSVDVSATDYERKRKTFHVDIILEPTRVVEKIELNFFIK